ncbi:hypothetical protein [Taylorella asinigenitalis]|uniref:Conserved hypothetical phage protein n=1 Tax=Taylorella asinigenitalis (strain MCE3) TaxID=1008459 RepID=G4QCS4_TAYAM|nr:hypothetical protein [Taylorella asinigenitalis]AEP36204.1 conserved hypothetical phage protein [Taylorella asinigenitalis MCE3]
MYRNKKLLNGARDCPYCMLCSRPNDGTIVAAHSNQLRDGKGKSIKAHDYLCYQCHYEIDQGANSKEQKLNDWETAHRKTVGYMIETGLLK